MLRYMQQRALVLCHFKLLAWSMQECAVSSVEMWTLALCNRNM